MNKNLHRIDEIFKEGLDDIRSLPDDTVWESIASKIQTRDKIYTYRFQLTYKKAAALVIFLLLSYSLYEIRIQNNASEYGQNKFRINSTGEDISLNNSNPAGFFNPVDEGKTEIKQKISKPFNSETSLRGPAPIKKAVKSAAILKTKEALSISKTTTTPLESTILPGFISKDFRNSGYLNYDKMDRTAQEKYTTAADRIPVQTLLPGFFIPVRQEKLIPATNHSNLKNSWVVTGFISNDFSRYNLEDDVPENINGQQEDNKAELEKREKYQSAVSGGILLARNLTNRFSLESGVIFTNSEIKIDPQQIYAVQGPNGNIAYKLNLSTGYSFIKPNFGLPPAAGDSLHTSGSNHKLSFISIPVLLKLKTGSGRLNFSPAIGITGNLLTKASVETEIKDPLNSETVFISRLDGQRKISLGLMGSGEVSYKLNKQISISLIPSFRYSLTSLTKNNVVKTFPYSFNIGAGISYKL